MATTVDVGTGSAEGREEGEGGKVSSTGSSLRDRKAFSPYVAGWLELAGRQS